MASRAGARPVLPRVPAPRRRRRDKGSSPRSRHALAILGGALLVGVALLALDVAAIGRFSQRRREALQAERDAEEDLVVVGVDPTTGTVKLAPKAEKAASEGDTAERGEGGAPAPAARRAVPQVVDPVALHDRVDAILALSGGKAAERPRAASQAPPLAGPEAAGRPVVRGDGAGGELDNAAVLVVAYNRADYLRRTLDSLAHVQGLRHVTVYVSQDGHDRGVRLVAEAFGGVGSGEGHGLLAPPHTRGFEHWERERVPELGPEQPGHAWLAQHYRFALDRVFREKGHSHVIIVEDDMLFAPDFLHLFAATAPLLQRDPTLLCVSSWNDNGMRHLAKDTRRLFRTSYFPGLGWMMARALWDEIGLRWPQEHWDHWMRMSSTNKGRECVVPEVNRNYNIGEVGANMEKATYDKYLSKMAVAGEAVGDFGDLSYLLRDRYDAETRALIRRARPWDWRGKRSPEEGVAFARQGLLRGDEPPTLLLTYFVEEYERLAQLFGLWPTPRGHHGYVTTLRISGVTFLLADLRYSPHLPEETRVKPPPTMEGVAADPGQSCSRACELKGKRCSEPDLWFLNTCDALTKHFPCERGCAVVLGDDIPNYVVDQSLSTHQQCLVNERQPTCGASHRATARLCACV